MPTPYTDIIPLVRAVVGDFGTKDQQGNLEPYSFDYDDASISSTLTLALLKYPSFSGNGTQVTPEITTDNDLGSITYYTALLLALPEGEFSLHVPNMKYFRKANENLLANILGELSNFNDDGAAMPATWGVWDKALNEGKLVADRYRSARGAV